MDVNKDDTDTEWLDQEEDSEYEAYLEANVRRDRELMEFVDDLLQSRELVLLLEFLNPKESTISSEDTTLPPEKAPSLPLIDKMREMWKAEQRLKKVEMMKMASKIKKGQEKSIAIIRKKIEEAKERYFCHQKERADIEEQRKKEIVVELTEKYRINPEHLTVKSPAVEKVLAYNKIRRSKTKEQTQRRIEMIQKILNEYKRQKQIDALRNKRYDEKVKRKEKIMKDMDIIGTKMTLNKRKTDEDEEEEEEEEETTRLESIKIEIPIAKSAKSEKETKNETKAKSEKEKPAKETKGKDKGKPLEPQFELPYVPITNVRQKITLEEQCDIENLIKEFDALKTIQKERQEYLRKKYMMENVPYPQDTSFSWLPKSLDFLGYQKNAVYKKQIRLLNGGVNELRCRFHEIKLEPFYPCFVQVEPVGVRRIIPGLSFLITVTFKPDEVFQVVKGIIVFVTYHSKSQCMYKHFAVPFLCIPTCSFVTVAPSVIKFPTLRIWEAKRMRNYQNYRNVMITNLGNKACRLTITKAKDMFEPNLLDSNHNSLHEIYKARDSEFEEEPSLNDEEIQNMAQENLYECIGTIFEPFQFQSYCIDLGAKSEVLLRVYFKNVDYVGYYNEKYLFSVYEAFDENFLNCVGCQDANKID